MYLSSNKITKENLEHITTMKEASFNTLSGPALTKGHRQCDSTSHTKNPSSKYMGIAREQDWSSRLVSNDILQIFKKYYNMKGFDRDFTVMERCMHAIFPIKNELYRRPKSLLVF